MALSLTPVGNVTSWGDKRVRFCDVAFDASYPTGGEPLTWEDVPDFTTQIDLCVAAPAAGLIFEYDHADNVLLAFYPSGGGTAPAALAAPAAGATAIAIADHVVTQPTISAPVATLGNAVIPAGAVPVESTGAQPALTITQPTISAPVATLGDVDTHDITQPDLSLVAGVGLEVADTTDLSTVTTRVMFVGT